MSQGFTFEDFNTKLNDTFFTVDANNDIQLNVSKICGIVFSGLSDYGILKFTYFFLRKCFQVQTEVNKTATTELDEFNNPVFGTVDATLSPPSQLISIAFDAKIPLAEDEVMGVN